MTELRFTVPGKCTPWQRTAGYHGRRLTPREQRDYQRRVARAASLARPRGWQLDARYAVELLVYEPDARRRDVDNEIKTCLDALNAIAWDDDSQVDALAVVRRIDREAPRVEVTVVPMTLAERDRARAWIEVGAA